MTCHVKNQSDLEEKLKEAGDKLVVIDFFATWCGPCKLIAPKIEAMAEMYPNVVFLKVDVEECEDVATEYQISAMPTFVFILQNKKVECFTGANYEVLKETVEKLKTN